MLKNRHDRNILIPHTISLPLNSPDVMQGAEPSGIAARKPAPHLQKVLGSD